jgi:hypothetical protein
MASHGVDGGQELHGLVGDRVKLIGAWFLLVLLLMLMLMLQPGDIEGSIPSRKVTSIPWAEEDANTADGVPFSIADARAIYKYNIMSWIVAHIVALFLFR